MIGKNLKILLGSVLFFSMCCIALNAQTTAVEKTVYSFFSKPKKIKWLHHYKGRIDDVHDIAIALAYDGKSCKGLLTFLKSREQLRLDGELKANQLTLLEVDQKGNITSQYVGSLDAENLYLDWSDNDNIIGFEMFLSRIQKEDLSKTPCGDDKWIRVYNGTVFGKKVDMLLQKTSRNELRGNACFENETMSYELKGEITEANNLSIVLINDKNQDAGKLDGVFSDENTILANFYNTNGLRTPAMFSEVVNLEVDCVEYADYTSSYHFIFPKISNNNFNRRMADFVELWVKDCRQQADKIKYAGILSRASVRAYAWYDIAFYDGRFISGMLNFENSWDAEHHSKALNFDLENGREVLFEDLFTEDFDCDRFVSNFLHQNDIEKHHRYRDFEFRKWLASQQFSHFLIQKDGITFCTGFDKVYGRQKVKVPYEKLKPFLKEYATLQHLVN